MNIPLLQEIKARILAEPDAFRMDQWSCGTAHCIAGWACALVGDPVVVTRKWDSDHYIDTASGRGVGVVAAEALEIELPKAPTEDFEGEASQSDRLFHVESWPFKLEEEYQDADDAEEVGELSTADARRKRAEIAAARIDHFIATDGEE